MKAKGTQTEERTVKGKPKKTGGDKRKKEATKRLKGNRGFTLIELLVVIAIIAILAAILFPVFARARQKAHQATCQGNLKQIAMAIIQYADDYDGAGVMSFTARCYRDQAATDMAPGGICNSALALGRYGAGWADFNVVGSGEPIPVSGWRINPLWQCKGNGTGTYKMLAGRGGGYWRWELNGASEWGQLGNPVRAGLVGDAWGWTAMTAAQPSAVYGYWWHFITPRSPDNIRAGPPDYNSAAYRSNFDSYTPHNGGNNMAFVDGHVKRLDARQMMDTDWWGEAFK